MIMLGECEAPLSIPFPCFPSLNVCFHDQVVLLSATMPEDVLEVTKKFMREPIRILVKKEALTLEGIRQFYVQVEKEVGLIDNSDWW